MAFPVLSEVLILTSFRKPSLKGLSDQERWQFNSPGDSCPEMIHKPSTAGRITHPFGVWAQEQGQAVVFVGSVGFRQQRCTGLRKDQTYRRFC